VSGEAAIEILAREKKFFFLSRQDLDRGFAAHNRRFAAKKEKKKNLSHTGYVTHGGQSERGTTRGLKAKYHVDWAQDRYDIFCLAESFHTTKMSL